MADIPFFKTRARVLKQLGEQLIKNESIAVLELIKNSYDADASKCTVKMYNPESVEDGKIVIEDDGTGMDYETLSTVWLEIGTSYKEDLAKTPQRSTKFHRPQLGEKGIGRFGAHRLGKEIKIISRKSGGKEAVLTINWDDIDNAVFIEDLPVNVSKRTPKTFVNGSGTKIIIKRFRVPWTKKMARDCARTIMSLNSPFEDKSSFRSSFEIVGSTWLKGLMSFADVKQYKLFSFDLTITGNKLTEFTYEFSPWDTMSKLNYRKISLTDPEMKALARMQYKGGKGEKYIDIDLSNYEIGEVRFKGIIFDRDTRTLSLGLQDKKGLKDYLDVNGGIRVFRDNMRVLDYGEPGNDWLDLGGRRVNMPTKRISNNIVLGAVFLKRNESRDLIEQANREGFVEDDAYWELWRAIRFAIDRIESLRKTDKDLLRKHYGPQATSEPVITSISELKEVVEKKVKEESTRTEICRYLDRIENEYDTITDSLMRSAGAGLNLIVVVHQIEKIIKEIKAMLKSNAEKGILEERIKSLSDLVDGYCILVKKSDKKTRNLKGVIDQCVFNIGFRLDAHNIALEPMFQKRVKNLDAICSEDHVLNALMNIFDNSIWWLGYSQTRNPSIMLDISDVIPGHVSIVIADNGPGFTKPTEQIIKPFVSDKPGGMGIGLHLTHQIMESLGGKLVFPDMDLFNLPKKYKKGATVILAFKKGGK